MSGGLFLSDLNLCVSPGVPSNLKPLVHYTSMDDFSNPNLNQAIPSDNIMVQDSFYHGSVSRNLSFSPSSNHTITW